LHAIQLTTVTREKEDIAKLADVLAEENAKQKQLLEEAAAIAIQNEERAATIDKLAGRLQQL
jgi:DNA-directed RNA polymerase beta' subunit